MQKNILKLLMSLLLVLGVSCTEEISEELKEAANESASSGGGSAVKGKMALKSTMDAGLSHFMHLQGDSRKPCQIEAPATGWKAEDYQKAQATDCILEVEELDLYRNGAEFQLNVDAKLCEYVSYTPMRFANFQPGHTVKKEFVVGCDDVCSELSPDYCANLAGRKFSTYDGSSTVHSNSSVFPFYDEIFSANTCRYDYTDPLFPDNPNCDEGKITTYKYNISAYENQWCDGGSVNLRTDRNAGNCETAGVWTPAHCPSDPQWETEADCDLNEGAGSWVFDACSINTHTDEASCTATGTLRALDCMIPSGSAIVRHDADAIEEFDCGGDRASCFEGPGIDLVDGDPRFFTGTIVQNDALSPVTIDYDVEAPLDRGHTSNRYAASYQRTCVSDQVKNDYEGGGVNFEGDSIEVMPVFTGFTNIKDNDDAFSPNYLDAYPVMAIDSDGNGIADYIPMGTHPFQSAMQIGGTANLGSKTYYSIKCLDQSRDVKAQIRLHIREWDRAFTKDSVAMNKVSDIDSPGVVLIDNNGIHDNDDFWNDRRDWEDWWEKSTSIFTDNNCREVKEHPAKGECLTWQAGVRLIDVTKLNIEDCNPTQGPGVFDYCSNGADITRRSCILNGGQWADSLWVSDDNSKSNFPGEI